MNDVHWLYVTPAADFVADGPKTGKYVIGTDDFMTNKEGVSKISYADFALAFVYLMLNSKDDHKQVSVIGE